MTECDGPEADSELPKATEYFLLDWRDLFFYSALFITVTWAWMSCPVSPQAPQALMSSPWPAPAQAVGVCSPSQRAPRCWARLPCCPSAGSASACHGQSPQRGSSCSLHCSQLCRSCAACSALAKCSGSPACPVLWEGTSRHRLKVGWRVNPAFPRCWRLFLPAGGWLLWPGLHRCNLVLDSQ